MNLHNIFLDFIRNYHIFLSFVIVFDVYVIWLPECFTIKIDKT